MATEKKLIYLDEALNKLTHSKFSNPFFNGKKTAIWVLAHNCAMSHVATCSTVDAVEVIRCKDCTKEWCYLRQELGADGFCSAGERKDNA